MEFPKFDQEKKTATGESDTPMDFADKEIKGEPITIENVPVDYGNELLKGDLGLSDDDKDIPAEPVHIEEVEKSHNIKEDIDDQGIEKNAPQEFCEESPLIIAENGNANDYPENVKDIVTEIISGEPEISEEVDPEFLNDFLVESKEHIESIEMNVLALETDPDNMEIIHTLFRSFHTIKGLAGFVNQNLIIKIAHQTETQLDKCRKGETKVSKYFVDLILASSDYLKMICEDLSLNRAPEFLSLVDAHLLSLSKGSDVSNQKWEDENKYPEYQAVKVDKLGEILVGQGLDQKTVEELLVKQEEYPGLKLGQIAVKEKKAEAQEVIQSLRIQEKASNLLASNGGFGGYTRVSTVKVDNMVDLIGELVIIQSQIEQEAIRRFGTNDLLVNNLVRMEKISKDIQNISMSLRMVSLKSTFQKLNRICRDTIAELGKNVLLEIEGEETEIDRGVAERLLDPLLHLIKNSIAHGIEEESERIEKGKPSQGRVKIQASSKRGSVYIEISDDGKGMSVEQIQQKALEKNLLDPAKTYTEDEIINMVFMPGFSTVENINNISGRGVGLDVVKTEISNIGGKVELNNLPGLGCSFILKIPINLAVINGTIIDIMGTPYIIPTLYIKQILKPEAGQWVSISERKVMIRIKDDVIPTIPIMKIFGIEGREEDELADLVIVIELEQTMKALPVRSIINRREIVVKPLGREFSHLDYVAGASILGDGRVSLILDIETLFKHGEAI